LHIGCKAIKIAKTRVKILAQSHAIGLNSVGGATTSSAANKNIGVNISPKIANVFLNNELLLTPNRLSFIFLNQNRFFRRANLLISAISWGNFSMFFLSFI
jgi:hypothetical protein